MFSWKFRWHYHYNLMKDYRERTVDEMTRNMWFCLLLTQSTLVSWPNQVVVADTTDISIYLMFSNMYRVLNEMFLFCLLLIIYTTIVVWLGLCNPL